MNRIATGASAVLCGVAICGCGSAAQRAAVTVTRTVTVTKTVTAVVSVPRSVTNTATTAATTTAWPTGSQYAKGPFDDYIYVTEVQAIDADAHYSGPKNVTAAMWTCLRRSAQSEPGETYYKWSANIDQWSSQQDAAPPNTQVAPPADIAYAMTACGLIQP